MNSGEAVRLLRDAGYLVQKVSQGSHWVFRHPDFPRERSIVVPMHGKKELSAGVEAVIRKALRNKK